MNIEKITKLLEVLVSLIKVIAWPSVVLFVLFTFKENLKKLLEDLGEFTIEAGKVKGTFKRQIEAAAFLGAAAEKQSNQSSEDRQISGEEKAKKIVNIVSQAVTRRVTRQLAGASGLWVDDHPDNNIYERKALEALGINLTISTSTEDAIKTIRHNKYDVIISDMGRHPDSQAGYTLLEEIQKRRLKIPFIIYAGSNLPEHKDETRRRGGFGTTNNPQELFSLVIDAIQNPYINYYN